MLWLLNANESYTCCIGWILELKLTVHMLYGTQIATLAESRLRFTLEAGSCEIKAQHHLWEQTVRIFIRTLTNIVLFLERFVHYCLHVVQYMIHCSVATCLCSE